MQSNQPHTIDVSQLQVGMYVHLDLGWMDHPFTTSNFKLKDDEQIAKIKNIGLKTLRYDPKRSDSFPLPAQAMHADADKKVPVESKKAAAAEKAIDPKAARLAQLHSAMEENEKRFVVASDITKQAINNIISTPQDCIEQVTALVNTMVDTALMEGDVAIHALNGNCSSDKNYQHPLNVAVIALMLAKSIEMTKEDVRLLGLAAVFHDIGKAEIAENILKKKEPLTKSEQSHYEQHSEIGARIAKEVGLPVRIGKVILQHHEHMDGTGFPKRLRGEQIDPLARLVALANGYDNLCNPTNPALNKTPYEALAYMYANQRTKFDESLLKHMIKTLGVYPPGSIVQLSSGMHAIVISANPSKPLRPYIKIYDPQVSRFKPRILDLREEPNINIMSCIRANQLPQEVADYLNPRTKISYFMNAGLLDGETDAADSLND